MRSPTPPPPDRRRMARVILRPSSRSCSPPTAPATVRYPRDPTLDPQLVWKGKAEQDAGDLEVPAVPIYIGETIDPLALIEELRGGAQPRNTESACHSRYSRAGGGLPGKGSRISRPSSA
jgi:hypothetical protein